MIDLSTLSLKHLGIVYNRLSSLEGVVYPKYKSERSRTPNLPPFPCNAARAIQKKGFTRLVHEEKEEEEKQEYEEDYEDEEAEKQSIDINTSPKHSKTMPISVDP
ncbi:unnamed protein product [Microthlaspi erraticum]|uniref:Uncharacterized protein n=1 Tax=Microthlaspi erraticum TaxID=1685480 RepID=A0A6D2KCK5_9BRAS|nr:unnamed protein product [Microthlaspi erraticum]